MPRWKLISGARPFYAFPGREDVAIGWARDLQRDDVQRTVNVVVSVEATEASDLPSESRDAIKSHGRSVINALLSEEELPWIVDVTPSGLEREYKSEEEEEAEEEEEDDDWDEDDEDEDEEPADDED